MTRPDPVEVVVANTIRLSSVLDPTVLAMMIVDVLRSRGLLPEPQEDLHGSADPSTEAPESCMPEPVEGEAERPQDAEQAMDRVMEAAVGAAGVGHAALVALGEQGFEVVPAGEAEKLTPEEAEIALQALPRVRLWKHTAPELDRAHVSLLTKLRRWATLSPAPEGEEDRK